MSHDKQVLVVDSAGGTLSSVMEELDELGFRVVWVPTLSAALEFIKASPRLSLMIASASATRVGGLSFLAEVREHAPSVRIIWGARPDGRESGSVSSNGRGPDSLIPEPFHADELRRAISELLAEHFYPSAIADAVKLAALEVLANAGDFAVESGAFLVGNQTALSEISAVIPFTGGASGHLMIGVTSEHAKKLYEALVPGTRPLRLDRLEDLVGELCNQILGRINSFFAQRAVLINQGTPMFIRAPGSTVRYPGRQPSFGVAFVDKSSRVALEYYLCDFDRASLQSPIASRVLPLGEVRYL